MLTRDLKPNQDFSNFLFSANDGIVGTDNPWENCPPVSKYISIIIGQGCIIAVLFVIIAVGAAFMIRRERNRVQS